MSNETALWRAVIEQALRDALSQGAFRDDYETQKARRWFCDKRNTNFEMVCALADVDPDAVRQCFFKKAHHVKKRPHQHKSTNTLTQLNTTSFLGD